MVARLVPRPKTIFIVEDAVRFDVADAALSAAITSSKPQNASDAPLAHKGFSHGMPTTQADTINADLLAFLKA